MYKKRNLVIVCITLLLFAACKDRKGLVVDRSNVVYQCPMTCEVEKTYNNAGSCPICKMDLKPITIQATKRIPSDDISDESIFNLTSKWNTEEGETIELKNLQGKTLVMVMIYTTCKAACPRLVADMRNIEKQVPEKYSQNIQYVLVSIDPENDTPKRLKTFAQENFMDTEQWTFLQGTPASVRAFANVLAVKYKQISPMDFSHSNIISVFNPAGELIHQQEGLGVDNKETIQKIIETVKNNEAQLN